MASELIEKIKVFYFLTLGVQSLLKMTSRIPDSRTRGMLPQAP